MAKPAKDETKGVEKPNPALKRLDRFVGKWKLKGRPLNAVKDSIAGTTTFKWIHGAAGKSFFLQQDMNMDYDGMRIKSRELIFYDPKRQSFSSLVFSNMAPDPWPYQWDVEGDDIRMSIKKKPMDATFTGKFAANGKSFRGGWRPNPGADETVNAPYDVVATRVE